MYTYIHTLYAQEAKYDARRLGRGGGLGSRPKEMYGERLGDGVEYHLIHTYIHTYIHTPIHTCKHTCKHTYILTNKHANVHAHNHADKHTHIHTYIHKHTDTHPPFQKSLTLFKSKASN